MTADLRHVDTWIFDLDDTLYPPEAEVMALVSERMTGFVERFTGLRRDEARALQKGYLHEHGTTLAGLMAHHGVDPRVFLDEVHDVSLEKLRPDPVLAAALARLPGRRLVFTNGDGRHAERILGHMGIRDLFEDVFHLEHANWIPKPSPDTFARMVEAHRVRPEAAAFFEDRAVNLKPAADLGMTTVLVGPHALDDESAVVHHRTAELPPFLAAALIRDAAA